MPGIGEGGLGRTPGACRRGADLRSRAGRRWARQEGYETGRGDPPIADPTTPTSVSGTDGMSRRRWPRALPQVTQAPTPDRNLSPLDLTRSTLP